MKSLTAYKVCRIKDGKPVSAFSLVNETRYKWNQWNKPPASGNPFLWVFADESAARDFIKREFPGISRRKCALYKVSALNAQPTARGECGAFYRGSEWYPGTLFAEAVKLVRRIS